MFLFILHQEQQNASTSINTSWTTQVSNKIFDIFLQKSTQDSTLYNIDKYTMIT